jgi:hypothetical protein
MAPSMWEKVHVLLDLLEDSSRRYDVLKKPANSISKRRIGKAVAIN